MQTPTLPITEIIPTLKSTLTTQHQAILQAPPGAGKTTQIPLVLISEPWLGHKKILMLEPRRIATRAAATRMASLLGESVGQTVGYRMRLDSRVSDYTKIEVITEGILTRMLQEDPSLADVGLVIFDEFHERSLDADLALALCLKGREMFRDEEPLKLLVMSATLDDVGLSELLEAPVIQSAGKQYPVDVVYGQASGPRDNMVDIAVATTLKAVRNHGQSNVLVFLPGQGEIKRAETGLNAALTERGIDDVDVRPLYGSLPFDAQQAAIAPPADSHRRKIVLATNIAETSLTIEGVDVVVDSGLVREPVFDPVTAMTRLHLRKISQASSTQRSGRAGRLRPGFCYRLWSRNQQEQMQAHTNPEILSADVAPIAMQMLQWGIADPAELNWLDAPGTGPWQQALELLDSLNALKQGDGGIQLSVHGEHMSALAMHPRLAHMLINGAEIGEGETACRLASMLSERDPLPDDDVDVMTRLEILEGVTACPNRARGWQKRTEQLAQQYANNLARLNVSQQIQEPLEREQIAGFLIASAYPDRVARRRHAGGYQLANGRGASFATTTRMDKSRWLAVAEVGGAARAKGDFIRLAATLDETLFDTLLSPQVNTETIVEWDKKSNRFIAEQRQLVGELVLSRQKLANIPARDKLQALIRFVESSGLSVLSFTDEIRQWQARVELVRQNDPTGVWPEVTDDALLRTLAEWLGPYLGSVNKLADFARLDLGKILADRLDWAQREQLDKLAPLRLKVPSGSSHAIDYTQSPPVLAVKLQEMFGCDVTPGIVNNRVQLLIHLLSPAGRPLQVTQDLQGFWRSSYQDVKKEMKGRYPKHPWPDDPTVAVATRKTKSKS